MVWFYKNRALFSRVFPSGSPMDERFDAVRDGCNPLKLYRLNKYRKGVVVPVGGGRCMVGYMSEPLTSHFCVGCPRAGNRGLFVRAALMEPNPFIKLKPGKVARL